MKRRFRKSLVACLSCLALSCTGVGANLLKVNAATYTANASEIMTVSDGLTVEYNVSGSEKVSSLTKDTRTGIHFSAKSAGNSAEGNFVSFNNTLSGLFEMDFRVYTQNKATVDWNGGEPWYSHNNAEEIREVAITLTDVDENESFTLYIQGGTSWDPAVPNARVAYGDAGVNFGSGLRYGYTDGKDYDDTTTPYNGGTLSSKEYNTQIRGTSFTNHYLHSTVVGFDPITKEVYSYNFKSSTDETQYASILNRRVILDLDNVDHLAYAGTGASNLLNCKFNNYKVKFTLSDVTGASETGSQGKDEPANFILYSLNGQSLGGENGALTSSTAPGLFANVEQGDQYQEYEIPTPVLQSVLGEKPSFTGKVMVLDPNGNEIVAKQTFTAGLSFTPEETGTYTIVYSGVKDGAGNTRKALTAKGTFVGSEIVYSYPVEIVKANKVTANASEILDVNGLTATYNVSGSELHADLIRDMNKGIAFTSTGVGAEAVGSSVAFNNTLTGLMELNFRAYTETTDTSSDWWDGGNWYNRNNAEEIREIAITVTDKETNESFTVYIKGGTAWKGFAPNARVAYGDVGENYGSGRWYDPNKDTLVYKNSHKGLSNTEYNTEIVGSSFTNRARNSGGFIGSGYSTNIGFDPVTKVVYAYTYGAGANALVKRPILDLDDAEDMQYLTMTSGGGNVNGNLPESFRNSTFKNYTVKMTVTDMTDEKSAKFVVYSLNGQSLAGEKGKLMSTAGYGLYLPESTVKFIGLADNFPAPYASSVLTGEKAFSGTIEVVDEAGNVVVEKQAYNENVAFKPTAVGKYVAYYGGMTDENDCVRLKYNLGNYDGEEELLAYEFEVKENAVELPSYDYAMKKMGVELGAKPLGVGLTTYLTIKKDGAVYNGVENTQIGANYTFAFLDTGEYDLIYTVKTAVGGAVSYSTSVNVIAMTGSIKTTETVVILGEDCIYDASDFTVYYCDEGEINDFLVYATIYDGNSWVAVATSPSESVNLKNMLLEFGEGDWLVAFEVSKDGDSLRFEQTLNARDLSAPVIDVADLGEGFISVPDKDTDAIKNFVVLDGTSAKIPTATATDAVDGTVTVTVLLKTPNDSSVQVIAPDSVVTYVEGEYVIVYKAVDNAGNESSVFYLISVKSLWLNITANVEKVELGSAVVIPTPEVENGFTGEKLNGFDWTAKLYLNGEELENGEIPVYTGEYELVYTIAYAGMTQDYTVKVSVEDTQKPTVTIDGTYVTKANLGDKITVFDASVEDESAYGLTISVIFNGATRIQLDENNEFVADKAGEYLIKYSATDVAGNTTNVEFTITVKDPKASIFAGCSSSVSGTLTVSALLTALGGMLLLRKKEN